MFTSLIITTAMLGFISISLIHYGRKHWKRDYSSVAEAVGLLLAILSGALCLVLFCVSASWYASGARANIINREYGTSYTQMEVFLAEDVIDAIQQVRRQRIEVNGDILRERRGEP